MLIWYLTAGRWCDLLKKALVTVLSLMPTGCHPEIVARLASWVPCFHTPQWRGANKPTGLREGPSVCQGSHKHTSPYVTLCDNVDNRLPCTVRLQPHLGMLGGQSQGRDKGKASQELQKEAL